MLGFDFLTKRGQGPVDLLPCPVCRLAPHETTDMKSLTAADISQGLEIATQG